MLAGPHVDSGFIDNVALANHIATGLAGGVNASDYAVSMNERIFRNAQLVAALPEPGTLLLFAIGLALVGAGRWAQLGKTARAEVPASPGPKHQPA